MPLPQVTQAVWLLNGSNTTELAQWMLASTAQSTPPVDLVPVATRSIQLPPPLELRNSMTHHVVDIARRAMVVIMEKDQKD